MRPPAVRSSTSASAEPSAIAPPRPAMVCLRAVILSTATTKFNDGRSAQSGKGEAMNRSRAKAPPKTRRAQKNPSTSVHSQNPELVDINSLLERRKLRRKVQGIAAALLPYEADGRIAIDAFQRRLVTTHRAGLMN